MFILPIIVQLGVLLDTLSQLATARLDKTAFDNRQLQDFKVFFCHESNTQKTVSVLGIIDLGYELNSFKSVLP